MYSLRDSIIKPEELVERLKEIGQDTVAVTDHGECLGTVEIYKLCKANGIKPIIGVEFYICDDLTVRDKNSKYYHLVALCKNETGRINMNTLISLSERPENKYYKPRIDFDLLSQYGDGLVILSACLAGEVSKNLLADDYEKAKETALRYKDRFGEDYYLEIQAHRDPEQITVNKQILQLSKDISIPCVVTCDAHYTWEEDKVYQNKYAFNGAYKEDGESYIDCFIQSEDEVKDRLTYLAPEVIDSVINTTHIIADKCNVELPLSAPIMPKMEVPQEFSNSKEWLMSICESGFRTKLNIDVATRSQADPERKIFQQVLNEDGEIVGYEEKDLSQETIDAYIKRYEYELDSLTRMGFLDYMLLVYSYANIAKRRGIARGSGGGSLICYVSNITNIDPLEHKLYFERFIDVGALQLLESGEITQKELKIPDVDLDFSGESCTEVLHFLYDTYGEKRVASIGKFGTNKTKGTIRDMCKVLDIDLQTADEIAKSFESFEIDEIDAMIAGEIDIVPSAKAAIDNVKTYTELFDFVRKLNGLPKSFGLHACGKIIANNELDYYLPSSYDADGIRFLQGDMHSVEDVGLVKIDVLGLRTLDQEYDTLEMSGESAEFINPKQDYGDPKVLDIFRNGDTLGIFQFSSNGMKQTLKKMNVSGIDDLSAANALFRPGSMGYIDNYCNRKSGKEKFTYLHPDLEGILNTTYGIIVFQEQLIEIGRLAGMHNPDLLRKATGKKNPKLLAQVKPELEEKLKARGWSDEQFTQLWTDMLEFAKYSFNKAHSSAYAILAYITAKQKAYYPAEFYAGLCNSYLGQSSFVKDDADEIMCDMFRHKINIEPFNFRDDHRKCWVKNNNVVYAVPLIRDCNQNTAEVLYQFKDTEHKYFWALCNDMVKAGLEKSKLKILILLGFFNEYGNTKELLRIMDIFEFFKFGDRSSIKVSQVVEDGFMNVIIPQYSVRPMTKGGELSKTYKDLDIKSIMNAYEDKLLSLNIPEFGYKDMMITQKEYLGFVSLVTGKEEDRAKLRIKGVYPVCRKSDGKQFGYSIITQSIGSGKESRMTVFKREFDKDPIREDDIIVCKRWGRDGKYFQLLDYEHLLV